MTPGRSGTRHGAAVTAGQRLLLVNPWIHDFGLYDLWMKPVGLLLLADFLRKHGFEVRVLDCLNRLHPSLRDLPGRNRPRHDEYGCGKFASTIIPTPEAVRSHQRPFRRYGVPSDILEVDLEGYSPDAVLVTSGMTYWYPGVVETITWLRRLFPDCPVLLGGVYATLCPKHAREHSGADVVIPGWRPEVILQSLGIQPRDTIPPLTDLTPAHDLLDRRDSATTLTSFGCPHRCRYCASPLLWSRRQLRPVASLTEELGGFVVDPRIRDLAFVDDALLLDARDTLFPALANARTVESGIRLHTPNAVHARAIDKEMASLLREYRFVTLRIGLETASDRGAADWDGKVSREAFRNAMAELRAAGYARGKVDAYVMVGLPGQSVAEVETTLRVAHDAGAVPRLARFSPVPGTRGFDDAAREFPGIRDEPLLHNSSLAELRTPTLASGELHRLHQLALSLSQRPQGD